MSNLPSGAAARSSLYFGDVRPLCVGGHVRTQLTLCNYKQVCQLSPLLPPLPSPVLVVGGVPGTGQRCQLHHRAGGGARCPS